MAFEGRNISLIMASLTSGLMGVGEAGLPWKDPDDLRWFKKITMGGTIILGRKTFETLSHPLAGRKVVVLSGQGSNDIAQSGLLAFATTLEGALASACLMTEQEEEIFIAGGSSVYLQSIPYVDRFYISRISQDKMLPLTDQQIINGEHSPFPLPWDIWPNE